jgi:hypothetical protein
VVTALLERPSAPFRRFPCVLPDRDNTPRSDYDGEEATAHIFRGSTPELYEEWLDGAIRKTLSNPPEEQLVFINAWNEWSEGSYLEPDLKHGRAYLEATRRALRTTGAKVGANRATGAEVSPAASLRPPSTEKLYRDLLDKYALLQQQYMELLSAEEFLPLVQKTNQRIEELQRENRKLRIALPSFERCRKEVDRLTYWMQQADLAVSVLRRSRRWRVANTLGDASRRAVMRKPVAPPAEQRLVEILDEFRAWLYETSDGDRRGK